MTLPTHTNLTLVTSSHAECDCPPNPSGDHTEDCRTFGVMYGDGGRTTVGDLLRWLSAFDEDTTVVLGEGDICAPTLRLEGFNNERLVVIRAAEIPR